MMIASVHKNKFLKTSSFVEKDFQAHDVASTILFAFGSFALNLSNITSDEECKFIQYNIQVSCIRSLLIKGKLHHKEVESILLYIQSSSLHKGVVLSNHSSILKLALFTFIA